jgi:ATP-dependent Clp protease protease subunit
MKFLQNILVKQLKKIEKDTDRDNFLDAETAKSYGIVDSILEERN